VIAKVSREIVSFHRENEREESCHPAKPGQAPHNIQEQSTFENCSGWMMIYMFAVAVRYQRCIKYCNMEIKIFRSNVE
jgi:hypothetical protein